MNQLNLRIIFLSLALASTSEAAGISSATKSWLKNLQVPAGVYDEVAKFPNLTSDYIESVPTIFSSRASQDLENNFGSVIASKECVPKTEVRFLSQVSSSPATGAAEREFESQIVHIQVIACLEAVTSAQVIAAYVSPEFKQQSADTIVKSKCSGRRTCQVTQVQVLGESEYCYDEVTFKGPEATYVHSFNDWNRNGVQAPVYFRQMLAAAADMTINGRPGTAFYTNVYVRGVKLPGLFKSFAKSSIAQGQQTSLNTLHSIATKK
jgi:hypothetical protein